MTIARPRLAEISYWVFDALVYDDPDDLTFSDASWALSSISTMQSVATISGLKHVMFWTNSSPSRLFFDSKNTHFQI